MTLYALDGLAPELADESGWIADSAAVIGKVILGRSVSIWFGCVLRGDNEPIAVGARTNIQENAIRSEEHTSELQSLMRISYAVFCLKKKKKPTITHTSYTTRMHTYS